MPATSCSRSTWPKTWNSSAIGRCLHHLGEIEVKHGSRVSVVNLYTEELGNPEVPQKFLQARHKAAAEPGAPEKPRTRRSWIIAAAALLLIGGLGLGGYFLSPRSTEGRDERRAVRE